MSAIHKAHAVPLWPDDFDKSFWMGLAGHVVWFFLMIMPTVWALSELKQPSPIVVAIWWSAALLAYLVGTAAILVNAGRRAARHRDHKQQPKWFLPSMIPVFIGLSASQLWLGLDMLSSDDPSMSRWAIPWLSFAVAWALFAISMTAREIVRRCVIELGDFNRERFAGLERP